MAVSTALPTLSQVQTMDTTHLDAAVKYWTRTANLWEEVFSEVHQRVSTPGGTPWKGRAAAAEEQRSALDLLKVRAACDQLHQDAEIARRGDEALRACQAGVLEAVDDGRAEGFDVGEDYSVTDRALGGSAEFRATRRAAAQGHAAFIRHRAAALVAKDHEIATQIAAATNGIDSLTFDEAPGIDDTIVDDDKHSGIQPVDNRTFKEAPNPAPDPPPGGWSSDPLMRAAQKIAYGHASGPGGHMADFPGMTKDQLAERIYTMLRDSINNPKDLILGNSVSDGAPVIYDPKTNIVVIRDPTGAGRGSDAGTVFKPGPGIDYILGNPNRNKPPKIAERVDAFPPSRLEDIPRPAGPRPPVEPGPPKPPGRAPVEPAPPARPGPGVAEGGAGLPRLPLSIGTPWDSPATGPHPVYPPHHHHPLPVLGEIPDEIEDP
ncbi:hypothetical protein MSIMFI_05108 [Mycobacterium simulans]|uniref:hypothetical protein n=1 Tax=Mycobacterium simulans TaxID=627089 RepID=UPI00174A02DE|nr:hypothetical protein [Mycobacterium simulans]SON63577.1 hypothetical protein MSIMFI_05108 [Mycobacterium simulans]